LAEGKKGAVNQRHAIQQEELFLRHAWGCKDTGSALLCAAK
jgi:hypothetical protein